MPTFCLTELSAGRLVLLTGDFRGDAAGHPIRRYDYFVCRGNAATTGYVDTSIYLSDHYAVDFAF